MPREPLTPCRGAGRAAAVPTALAAAGREVRLSAAGLTDFDSSALSLLLSAARQCSEQGATLKLDDAPEKLRELARVYGVSELFWPVSVQGA